MPTKTIGVMAGLALFSALAVATPSIGMTSQSTRSKINLNLYATQWGSSPLFNLVMQSSPDAWGYDLVHTQNTWAPAAADGTPSQSGWHNHPVPIGLVQIIQGGVWIQEEPHLDCLTYHPTGSMFIEGGGHIHNAYNLDKKTPAVVWATWLIERYLPSTRTEQPDQVTGDPNVASPPPPLCKDSPLPPAN